VPVVMSSAAVPSKTFRASRKPFRDRAKTVRLPAGITVRLQPGIPFAFIPESFSRSPRNPFRLPPESAGAGDGVLADWGDVSGGGAAADEGFDEFIDDRIRCSGGIW
jgi:hypothetical protein